MSHFRAGVCLWLILAITGFSSCPATLAADRDSSWASIIELDEGPKANNPSSRDEVVTIAKAHLVKQRAALESFIVGYPHDARVFDARMRLAAIDAAEGHFQKQPNLIRKAVEDLIALEKSEGVTQQQRADATFRRISLQMQTLSGRDAEQRELVRTAARNFALRFPSDIRAARLLVEASTIFSDFPETMRSLLSQAQSLTAEPALLARIRDDLNRLNRLGQPLDITLSTLDGGRIETSALRGRVVAIIFWSAESPHSLLWLQNFRAQLRKIPVQDVVFLSVSLDENADAMREALRVLQVRWPTHFDGNGWDGELVRSLGINALPTLWLLDKRGKLRSLNARDHFETTIRSLQRER